MPTIRRKFKKKIAELLAAALAESSEFSAAFKVERAAPVPKKAPAESATPLVSKTEVFGIDTERFKEALKSVPEDLLDLISRQFGASAEFLNVEEFSAPEPVFADAELSPEDDSSAMAADFSADPEDQD